MVKLQFYPIDITYREEEERAAIHLYGRTKSGDQVLVIDRTFQPYFYALLKPTADTESFRADLKNIKIEDGNRIATITDSEIMQKKYFGKTRDAIKIYANFPKSIPILRDSIKANPDVIMVLEADIPFTRRYLIDRKIMPLALCEVEGEEARARTKVKYIIEANEIKQISEEVLENPRMLAFDIETYSPDKRIIPEQNPVLMIAFHGDNDFRKVITWKKFKTDLEYVEFVNSEADLVERFKQVIDEYRPDFLAGYFSDGFDLPYLKVRADKYKIKLDLGLDFSSIDLGKGTKKTAQITGIVHFDIFKYVSKVIGRTLETESYRLDLVAQELLGEGKHAVDIGDLHNVWDNNDSEQLEKFCRYNLQDASLTLRLAKKVLPNVVELVKIIGLTVYDVNRMSSSQLVEWFLIKQCPEYNQLIPNKPPYQETRERIESTYAGALVYEPKPGFYTNIAIFDYRSLYPSIISSHNISPGTVDCECCEGEAELVPQDASDKSKERHWFCKKKKGFVPAIIEELIKRRARIKEMMKKGDAEKNTFLDARQQSLKLLANSFYGYLGFFGARWYSLEAAKSVTAYGRYYIMKVINAAKIKDFEVIYSDTDSIFLSLEGKELKSAMDFNEEINRELPGIMELEYEGLYPAGIFVAAKEGNAGAKKKYALLDSKGMVKVKGFEAVRRNWSFIAKETQEKVLELVLNTGKGDVALKYVQNVVDDLREHKVELAKVEIHMQLQKPIADYDSLGPHVKVAMQMRSRGTDVGPGSIIKYVITSGKGRIGDRAKLTDEITQQEYDSDYYINNQLIPAVEKILAVFGIEKDDILKEKKQSKLDGFFA